QRPSRVEGPRGSVGVVAIGDAADRMAEDLDRRLGDVLVVVHRARLAQILQLPRLFPARLDIRLWSDAGQRTERLEAGVWSRTATKEDGILGTRVLRHDALDVGVDGAVHRP